MTCIAAIVLLELHDERYDEEDKDDRTILANPATTDGFPALIPRRSRISFWSVSASGNRQLEILILIIKNNNNNNTNTNTNNNNTTNNITTNNYYCYKNNLGGFFSNTSGAQWSLESSPNSNRSYRFGNRCTSGVASAFLGENLCRIFSQQNSQWRCIPEGHSSSNPRIHVHAGRLSGRSGLSVAAGLPGGLGFFWYFLWFFLVFFMVFWPSIAKNL